jgi:hypothetical protein
MSKGCPQAFEQKLWRTSPGSAQVLQTSVLFRFNSLVVGTPTPVVWSIQTPQVFCGEYRGENRSQTIREGQLLRLIAADSGRTPVAVTDVKAVTPKGLALGGARNHQFASNVLVRSLSYRPRRLTDAELAGATALT